MRNLNALVGQDVLRRTLLGQIGDAKERSALLPHILLCGPSGRGKTAFAAAIAEELGGKGVEARSIARVGDLSALLTNLAEFEILALLDIDALPGLIMDVLVAAVESRQLRFVIGQGSSAREIQLELPRFTIVGTTSKLSRVDARLTRWMTSYDLVPYSDREMQEILTLLATDYDLTLTPEAAQLLVKHSEGSPESASVLLRKLVNHDYHVQGYVSLDTATNGLRMLGYQQHSTNSRDVLKKLRTMSGAEFEQFVAIVFQRQGYSAELTGASGDHGIDIILRKLGKVVAVQCKQWDSSIGEPVLRDFYGAIVNAGVNTGFVVTSSSFTAQAVTFAQNKPITLYDVDALIQLYLESDDNEKDIDPLRGTWSVARVCMEGKEIHDREIWQSRWTFLIDELTTENAARKKRRYRIRLDLDATPRAFFVQAEGLEGRKSGWMIYRIEGETLRVAFFNGLGERPPGFEPQKRLLVVELARTHTPHE